MSGLRSDPAVWLMALSLAGLVYTYAGYHLLIVMLGMIRPRPVKKGEVSLSVSVVIAAHNEERTIRRKLANILGLRGQERILEIFVGSDGSTDGTVRECGASGDARVRVIESVDRRGKPAVLNDLAGRCSGDIVVFMDARQEVEGGALVALLSNFADPDVVVVSGELVFRKPEAETATAGGMMGYWSMEKALRKAESRFRSVPGATGALYALRRDRFEPINASLLLDDVAIPMNAVSRGGRCVFEEGAVVIDEPSRDPRQEMARKRRTLAGNLQLAALNPRWICPGGHPLWFEFVSHKLTRMFTPFFVAGLVAAALWRHQWGLSRLVLAGAVLLVLSGVAAKALERRVRSRFLNLPFLFMVLNWTILGAWGDALRGRFRVAWKRAGT